MNSTLKRTWAEINLSNLKENYEKIAKYTNRTPFMGIVKADAYGHGAIEVSRVLQNLGAVYLAVSSIDEAMELRYNDITMPILILGHTPKEQVDRLICFNLTQTVSCMKKAEEYNEEALKIGKKLRVHIKVDTGMSRLGFLSSMDYFDTGIDGILNTVKMEGLIPEGLYTHFSMADDSSPFAISYTKEQLNLFIRIISTLKEKFNINFTYCHCANTGATINFKESYLDLIRPGLLLYGYGPLSKRLSLRPVMSLKTTVSTIKTYPPSVYIGYGGTFKTSHTTRVGVIPYGYADGFMRILSNKYHLFTEYGMANVIGKICMDMSMVDLTNLNQVNVDSVLEIFGENNPIENMAELAHTIPYELTCAVSKRVPRFYMEDGKIISKELLLRMS